MNTLHALSLIALLALGTACVPAPPATPVAPKVDMHGAQVARGQTLFRDKGCVLCHVNDRVPGESGGMYFGGGTSGPPNLTHYKGDPDFLRRWLDNPSTVRPGTAMPELALTDAQIEDLIAFLIVTQ